MSARSTEAILRDAEALLASDSAQDAQVQVFLDRNLAPGTARYYTADRPDLRQYNRRGAVMAYVQRRSDERVALKLIDETPAGRLKPYHDGRDSA